MMVDGLCIHARALIGYLKQCGLSIWSEHGEEPPGWVNIGCEQCHRTMETNLPRHPKEWEDTGEIIKKVE